MPQFSGVAAVSDVWFLYGNELPMRLCMLGMLLVSAFCVCGSRLEFRIALLPAALILFRPLRPRDPVAFAVRADHWQAAEAVEDVAVALAVSTEFWFAP